MALSSDATLTRRYDAEAGRWHRMVTNLGYDRAYRQLVEGADFAPRLLDVGTGSGALAMQFIKSAGAQHVDLMDLSSEMLVRAAGLVGSTGVAHSAHCCGLGSIEILEGSYDAVLCGHVIEHVPDPLGALRWLLGRLRPDGALYLSVSRPHWCTALIRWKWGNRAYRPEDVAEMLKSAGASEVRIVRYRSGPPSRTSCGYVVRRPKVSR